MLLFATYWSLNECETRLRTNRLSMQSLKEWQTKRRSDLKIENLSTSSRIHHSDNHNWLLTIATRSLERSQNLYRSHDVIRNVGVAFRLSRVLERTIVFFSDLALDVLRKVQWYRMKHIKMKTGIPRTTATTIQTTCSNTMFKHATEESGACHRLWAHALTILFTAVGGIYRYF